MKQTITINENQLKQIIKNVLSEAYSTPPFADLDNVYKDDMGDERANTIDKCTSIINNICVNVEENDPLYKYTSAINAKILEIEDILMMYRRKTIQQLGLQPYTGEYYSDNDPKAKSAFDGPQKNWSKRRNTRI